MAKRGGKLVGGEVVVYIISNEVLENRIGLLRGNDFITLVMRGGRR